MSGDPSPPAPGEPGPESSPTGDAASAPQAAPAPQAPPAPQAAPATEPAQARTAPPAPPEPLTVEAPTDPAVEAPTDPAIRTEPKPPWWSRAANDGALGHVARTVGYEVWVVLVTAAALAVIVFVVFQGRFVDLYIKLRPHAPVSGEVTLLTIGGEALYLWDPSDPRPEQTPRALLAEVVSFLDAADASVVVLDFLMDAPADGDEALAVAARAHGRVVVAERLETGEPASGRQFVAGVNPTLLGSVHGGFANFQVEQDTLFSDAVLVRRVPLVAMADRSHLAGPWPMNQVGGRQDVDQIVPALSLVAATLHRQGRWEPDDLVAKFQEGCPRLECTIGAPDLGLRDVPGPLPEPMSINFRGPEHADGIPVVDAARVLRLSAQAALMKSLGVDAAVDVPADLKEVLAGRIVVVGRVDPAANDRFTTPYSLPVPIEADMAGVRIHAHVIDTLLTGRHVDPIEGRVMWRLGALLALTVLLVGRRVRDDLLAAGCIALAVGAFAGAQVLFDVTDGTAIDLGPVLLGLLGALFLHLLGAWAVRDSR